MADGTHIPINGVIYVTQNAPAIPLQKAFNRWREVMDAATVPTADGGRVVVDVPGAIMLSSATADLFQSLGTTEAELVNKHSREIEPPPGIVVKMSDEPDGPAVPVPKSAIKVTELSFASLGDDAALLAAVRRAITATAMPTERHNRENAQTSTGRHARYQSGDRIEKSTLDLLDSVERLLKLGRSEGTPSGLDHLVTLDQAAGICSSSKRTLERLLQDGKLPEPDYPGGGGRAHKWHWSKIRPALEEFVRPDLPEQFPASRII